MSPKKNDEANPQQDWERWQKESVMKSKSNAGRSRNLAPQEFELNKEHKDQLWELLREVDDEEIPDVIPDSKYQSAATAFTDLGFNMIQLI